MSWTMQVSFLHLVLCRGMFAGMAWHGLTTTTVMECQGWSMTEGTGT
jgi:hypothetical protein